MSATAAPRPEPDHMSFSIGATRHGQPIKLVRARASDGRIEWAIHREQANQRDDSATVGGLDAALLRRIGEIAAAHGP